MVRILLPALLMTGVACAGPLEDWIQEVASTGGGPILIARLDWDQQTRVFRLPPDTPGYDRFTEFLADSSFAGQLMAAQALTVSRGTGADKVHLVFLNRSRVADESEELAVLAHEVGHAWLAAKRFPFVQYNRRSQACLAIHATDVVQHVVIRKAMDERGIEHRKPWMATLDRAVAQWAQQPLPETLPPCDRARVIAQWVDVRFALPSAEWPNRESYDRLLTLRYPDLAEASANIVTGLDGKDLEDAVEATGALKTVLGVLGRAAFPEPASTPLKTNQ